VQLDRLKSEFVATVSHELRTPMTSIKGYVDILLLGAAGALTPQQVEFLEIVRSNSERLAVLVNDLLDISRIESGRVSLSMQPLDLREVAVEAMTELRARTEVERKSMHIEIQHSPDLPRVLGDLEFVRQIFDNLMENAFHYTPPDGHIHIRFRQVGEQVQVDVQDDGIGVPIESQARVFDRFYRGDHPYVLATSGTGLGLAIVKHLVEMHNGRIWLVSSGVPGEGSIFSFTLPVYKISEPAKGKAAKKRVQKERSRAAQL
jgi:signal transduction histidine kinase